MRNADQVLYVCTLYVIKSLTLTLLDSTGKLSCNLQRVVSQPSLFQSTMALRSAATSLATVLAIISSCNGYSIVRPFSFKIGNRCPMETTASSLRPYSSFSRRDSNLRMVSYEDLMEKLPSKAVIDVVDASKSDKIVASDVASLAGVSLSQAKKDLTALASIAQGDIAVDKDGELIYSFPSNLSSALAQNSAKYSALQTFRKAWPAAFWLLRVSFGVTLLVSILAIYSTIIFISSSSSSSDDDRRRDDRGGGGGMSFNYFLGPSPFDFFYYRPYGYYGYYGQPDRDPDEMGFFESVFSYVFGDGDVNARLEEKRLSLAANLIRQNNGAVTAEQLAPFCDEAPPPTELESKTYVDEVRAIPAILSECVTP